ncbi:hypothetical protein AAFM49_26015 [Burkholderia pseudomallei]|uniref:hypothetical protein n=1 Tax=Burkholderia pseudomallei TaxID=28450 RepID=UPI00313D3ACA
MKTTAVRSPTGSDDPPARLSSPQQSFLAEVSRYGISHTTFELAPAMIPMPSFAVWRTVFMRDLAHAGLPDIAATHAIGEWVKLGTLEQRRTRDTARPLPVYLSAARVLLHPFHPRLVRLASGRSTRFSG